MTVTTLIERLKLFQQQGYGETPVLTYDEMFAINVYVVGLELDSEAVTAEDEIKAVRLITNEKDV